MDSKTRNNFEMNIWNPGALSAVNMTDNQIYETCGDLLDSDNHYCTPVPSRQTSGVLSTMPLTSTSSESGSSSKLRSKMKCAAVSALFLLSFSLFFVAIGCGGFAILEIQRLKEEVGILKVKVDTLRQVQIADVASLNGSISVEVQDRRAKLAELDDKILVASSELAQQLTGNLSLLRTDIQNGLSFLNDDVQKKLTLLADISSLDLVDLANNARLNITMVSDQLEELENQTELRFSDLQSTFDLDISFLEASTEHDLQQIANSTEERLDSLNSSLVEELRRMDSDILTLERLTYLNISQLSASQKRDFEQLSMVHQSLATLVTTNVADLRTRSVQSNNELQTAISRLIDETYWNISILENETTSSISSLTDELDRIEVELALEAHGNLSQLNLDLRESLDDLSLSLQERVADLEEETQITFTSITNQTEMRLGSLEIELQSNLMSLRQSASQDLVAFANQTLNDLGQIEEIFREDLSMLSNITYRNLTNLAIFTEQSIAELQDDTRSSLFELGAAGNETRRLLDQTALDTTNNFTNSRQEFEQNLLRLGREVQMSFEELNSSDSQIMGSLQVLDARINGTSEELNKTEEMLLLLISSEASSLRVSVVRVEGDISNTTIEVQNLNHLLQQQFNVTDASLLNLQDSLHLIALESYNNLTRLAGANDALATNLNKLAEETKDNISNSVAMLRTNLQEATEEASANLTQLALDVMETVSLLNTSLHLEIQGVSLRAGSSIALLVEEVSNGFLGMYRFVNNSFADIRVRLVDFSAAILDINSTINATSTDVTSLQALTNDVISLINDMKVNLTMRDFELAQNLDSAIQEIDSKFDSLREGMVSLEMVAHTNLTEVESDLLYQVQRVENITTADLAVARLENEQEIESLRSAVYGNITESNIALTQAIHELNISLLNILEVSSIENQISLRQILHSTETNFTSLRRELNFLIANLTMTDFELAQNFDSAIQEIDTNFDSLREGIVSLEMITRINLTEVKSALLYQVNLVQNETRAEIVEVTLENEQGIENLRSAVYGNVTESNIALTQAIHGLNISLLDTLEVSSMETQNSLSQIVRYTVTNFTQLRSELNFLTLNVTILNEQAEDFTSLQISTIGSIHSLNSSIHDLGLQLATTRGNVSAVTDEVELLNSRVLTHLNSTVDLFGGCVEEVSECSFAPMGSEFQSGCVTAERHINRTGFQTVDMRCEYTNNDEVVHLEINRLKRVGTNSVLCSCSVVSVAEGNGSHVTVSTRIMDINPILTCSLIIQRCPTTIAH